VQNQRRTNTDEAITNKVAAMFQCSIRWYGLLAVGFVSAFMPWLAWARTWNDSTGQFSVEADLVKVAEGAVHLRKSNGQMLVVPLERLSAADRKYVASKAASGDPDAQPADPTPIAKTAAKPERPGKPGAAPKTGPHAARRANPRPVTEEVLDCRVSYQFDQTPLPDAVEKLTAQAGCQAFFDDRAMQHRGLRVNIPVTAQGKKECLAEALGKILDPHRLAAVWRDEVLLITTAEEAQTYLETRVYQLIRPVPNPDPLITQIRARVAPKSWDSVGGPGSVSPFPPRALVVSQIQAAHRSLVQQFGQVLRLPAQRAGPVPKARAATAAKGLSAVVTCDFNQVSLVDAVASLEAQAKIRLRIDEKAIEAARLAKTTPVTKNLKGIRLESALRLILRELDLTWTADREGLLITTSEAAEKQLTEVRYDVRDLLIASRGNAQGLVNLITSTVSPTSWGLVGGLGSIQPGPGGDLRIKQNYCVHREIESLLSNLRTAIAE
jgi:hypothetical protein